MIDTTDYDGSNVYYDETVEEFYRFEAGTSTTRVLEPNGKLVEKLDTEEFHDLANDGRLTLIPSEVVEDPAEFLDGRLERLESGYYCQRQTSLREEVSVEYARQQVTMTNWEGRNSPAAVLCIPTEDDLIDIERLLDREFNDIGNAYAAANEDDDIIGYGSLLQELMSQLTEQSDD